MFVYCLDTNDLLNSYFYSFYCISKKIKGACPLKHSNIIFTNDLNYIVKYMMYTVKLIL